ncbi:hypothetical protein AS593_21065 [Caulobacter vibrioides]|nr:hypothetical protein AS593_21065 [Caulobacter vibrioides]
MSDFRLLSMAVKLNGEDTELRLSDGARPSAVTVIIGRNGAGKSTLLRETTNALRALAWASTRYLRINRPRLLQGMTVRTKEGSAALPSWVSKADVMHAATSRNLLPANVIALSFTPFDKFPLGDDVERIRRMERLATPPWRPSEDAYFENDPFYIYVGPKGDARTSAQSRLFDVITRLAWFGMDPRIASSLEAIGFTPEIKIAYRLNRSLLAQLRRNPDPKIEYDPTIEDNRVYKFFNSNLSNKFPELRHDEVFDHDVARHEEDLISPSDIEQFLSDRILSISSINLTDIRTEEKRNLMELSSGELNIITGFLNLAMYIKDGSLVLIDEPENSLHPAWQLRYTSMLQAFIERHPGCHYIIATHSPLILSGAARNGATTIRLDAKGAETLDEDQATESPDATLVTAFEVVTSHNNYLRQLVLKALTMARQGLLNTPEAHELSIALKTLLPQIPKNDEIRDVVAALIVQMAKQ